MLPTFLSHKKVAKNAIARTLYFNDTLLNIGYIIHLDYT